MGNEFVYMMFPGVGDAVSLRFCGQCFSITHHNTSILLAGYMQVMAAQVSHVKPIFCVMFLTAAILDTPRRTDSATHNLQLRSQPSTGPRIPRSGCPEPEGVAVA